ncbi:MAG: pitrilysin family protein [Candidatus Zixiibacteriota bacterium]
MTRNKKAIGLGILFILSISTILAFLSCSCPVPVSEGGIRKFILENGMEIILKENHATSMATSLIFVNAGAKYEDRFNNGATHFLEHLLFNGTATRSMEDISRGIDKLGGYINAFTRKEFTAYLVTMPRDYIEYGMATQADMLFNSVFPEDKFEKERGIVIEEQKKDNDAEGSAAEAFYDKMAMANTPYSQPVIGYESIIANIPREAIIDYYKRFYAPNNMIALIIGDFNSDEMERSIRDIFGGFPRVELPPTPDLIHQSLTGKKVYKASADTKSTYIRYSIAAPRYIEADYYAFNLLEDYLGDSENSPLSKALKTGSEPLVSSISAYLDTKSEFSRFYIELITENAALVDSIIFITDNVLESMANNPISAELLNGYKVSRRCDEIYLSEKLHYYGFMKAPTMAIMGWDAFAKLDEGIDSVSVEDFVTACRKYLSEPAYIAIVIEPIAQNGPSKFFPDGPTINDVQAHFDSVEYPPYGLMSGKDFKMPDIKRKIESGSKHASYLKEIFDNGLTVIVKSNPDSRVFALNVIGKNRSATEASGQDGITDFVNHMIEKGTTNLDAERLSKELASIGANVTLYDNPWIPYDDRYTTRQFSFMKFETIDQFTEQGIDLFFDIIANPAFDSVEVEKVRNFIFGQLGRNSGSPQKVARNEFYATLFESGPYAKTIEGNYRTLSRITADDLREHHHRMYSPENIIITVGTNEPADKVMVMVKERFGRIPATGFVPIEATAPNPIKGIKAAHEKMDKEQVYIYLGHLLPGANSEDASALKVANAILSERLSYNLREKQSLAYSVGSSVSLDKNFGWLTCVMGTGVENFEQARDGIIGEIERMKTDPPDQDELDRAINSMWGSYLMANLSRINQAYYMGVNEYLGLGYKYDDTFIEQVRAVTPDMVQKTAQKYFDTQNYIIATAGDI